MGSLNVAHLKDYLEKRLDEIRSRPAVDSVCFDTLMREALKFAERILRDSIGPHHYELSVFEDARAPQIVAYYDSAGGVHPRSADNRRSDPNYYRDKQYAVVNLLDAPQTALEIIADTAKQQYVLTTTPAQKVRSTILYCFDPERPAALVATCDQPNAFDKENKDLVEMIRAIGMAISVDIQLRARTTPSAESMALISGSLPKNARDFERAAPRNLSAPHLYRWIHLSDIHFGAKPTSHRFDRMKVGRAILEDARKRGREPGWNAVLVTGDIAFRADVAEYAEAAKWLKEFETASGVASSAFYFVPGNHDIDRAQADDVTAQAVHHSVRQNPRQLDDHLIQKSRTPLEPKLQAYRSFLQTNYPEHPQGGDGEGHGIDWAHVVDVQAGTRKRRLRLVGLSTVWVSDKWDGKESDSKPGQERFNPNLVLAAGQLQRTLGSTSRDELVLLLSHHPPEWLMEYSRNLLSSQLASQRHIHLCGHIHRKAATVQRHIGSGGREFRFVAGATHDEFGAERAEHCYAWGALRESGSVLEVGWGPRVYVPERNEVRADSTRYDLDAEGFVWEPLAQAYEPTGGQ